MNQITWHNPDPVSEVLHTAFRHETLLWTSKGGGTRRTFNYDLLNNPNSTGQISSVWLLSSVPESEKRYDQGQKALGLVRGTLLAFWTKH